MGQHCASYIRDSILGSTVAADALEHALIEFIAFQVSLAVDFESPVLTRWRYSQS